MLESNKACLGDEDNSPSSSIGRKSLKNESAVNEAMSATTMNIWPKKVASQLQGTQSCLKNILSLCFKLPLLYQGNRKKNYCLLGLLPGQVTRCPICPKIIPIKD